MFYDFNSNLNAAECHQRLEKAFKGMAPSYSMVKKWYARFKDGITSFKDDERCGRPVTASGDDDNAEVVRQIIIEDRHATYGTIATELGIAKGSVKAITDKLGVHKKLGAFIPHSLTDAQKQRRVEVCQFWLEKFDNGKSRNIANIVSGDETIIRQYEPHNKQQAAVWCFADEEPPSEVKRSEWVKQQMLTVFVTNQGCLAVVPLENKKTVTSEWYCNTTLKKMLENWDL